MLFAVDLVDGKVVYISCISCSHLVYLTLPLPSGAIKSGKHFNALSPICVKLIKCILRGVSMNILNISGPLPPTHEKSRKPRENVNELRMRWAQIRRRFFYFFWDTAYLYRKVFYKSGQWDGRILGLLRPTYVSYNPLGPASGCQLRTSAIRRPETQRPSDPRAPFDSISSCVGRSHISHIEGMK